MKMLTKGKGNDCFGTPDFFFQQLYERFSFTVDAACTSKDKKLENGFCYDLGMNGLLEPWTGHRVFCNPPFSTKDDWIRKAVSEVDGGGCPLCVMILPSNSMSLKIWFTHIYGKFLYEIVEGRISFLGSDGHSVDGNNSGSTVIYFMQKLKNRPSELRLI